jgi:hypothetical protein
VAGQLAGSAHPGSTFFAHGIGGRQDLPISFSLVLAGAVAALVKDTRAVRRWVVALPMKGSSTPSRDGTRAP